MAHSTPQGILDDVAMVSWNWSWFLFKLMWSYFSLGICGSFILNITSRFIELFLMRTCLCLGSRWRGRSLHSKNVEAVDIWNWGKEDRTGEIKPTRLSEFVRSQFCYLPVSGLSTCVYKTPPFHQQGAAALCVCVCVFGRGTLSCEQKGFAQTYCMIKLWLYFSPLLMPLLILLQLHFTHLFSNMLDTFCFDLLLSCQGAAPLCELINMLFFKYKIVFVFI